VSTPVGDPGDVITAALLQITQQAERLAVLDEREASHYREIAARLADLAGHVADTSERAEDMRVTAERRAAILGSLDGLDKEVAALAARITAIAGARAGEEDREPDTDAYRPAPAPRWWKLQGQARDEALARLRAWVEQIYRPGYGHLAAALGLCWDQHPLCLYGLDWLMELWSALYLTEQRRPPVLASQAEWQTRLLPALAEQMYLETTRCQHARVAVTQRASRDAWNGDDGRRATYQRADPEP
jgi:hypothetical protein